MTATLDAAPHAVLVAPSRALARRAVVGVVTGLCLASTLADALPADPTHAVATAGAALGLVLGAFTHRHPLRGRPCFGALAGAYIGSTVWLLCPGTPAAETAAVSAVVGAVASVRRPSSGWRLVSVGGGVRRTALSARQVTRELRPGTLAHSLVGVAAAIAVDDQRQARYTEEFRATLAEITGPLAAPRRLWCSLTILSNAALLRAELGEAADTDTDTGRRDMHNVAGKPIQHGGDGE
ncbi:hypothetical protein MXD63_17450 [Frankia sp. Cpl3]|nr:hypothetical protein [Frankia sp. Cpl3]